MDILRKMFKMNEKASGSGSGSGSGSSNTAGAADREDATTKDEFRKPQWFEETETDDELFDDDRKFAFQIFTNPMELQKHFERQMQQILEAVNELEEGDVKIDKNLKEDFLKPGFEGGEILKEFEKQKKRFMDTDLDGEIYADQLHSLMQRLAPNEELPNILPSNDKRGSRQLQSKPKLSDDEKIFGQIHGTIVDEEQHSQRMARPRPDVLTPMIPRGATPFGGVFEGTYQGPKMFSQSVMTKTVRKPDGSYETTRITKDSQGNKTTTVTRSIDGKTETVTSYDGTGGAGTIKQSKPGNPEMQVYSDRNIYVTKEGYAVPRNLCAFSNCNFINSTKVAGNGDEEVTGDDPLAEERLGNVREVGGQAVWSLSSCKPGFGVERLRDNIMDTYWQSDGQLPHLVNIQFHRKTSISQIYIYTDYKLDESYTPSRISIRSGTHFNDLQELQIIDLTEPTGWVAIPIKEGSVKSIRTFMLQIAVISNHQNGRDTHMRQIRIHAPAEGRHYPVEVLGKFNTVNFQKFATIR